MSNYAIFIAAAVVLIITLVFGGTVLAYGFWALLAVGGIVGLWRTRGEG